MYNNVTMRRVRLTIVAVETQKVLHILIKCILSYLPCKAYAAYCLHIVICGMSGYTLFFHIIS